MKLIPWSGFAIAGVRGIFAASVMAVFMAARRLRFRATRRSVASAVCLCGTMVLFAIANKTTTAANAIVLQFTSPIWIMLISGVLLHHPFSRADVVAVALTVLGIALCFADGLGAGSLRGNIIAVGSGLCLACYYIGLGGCNENERMTSVLIAHSLSVLIGLPFLFTTDSPVTAPSLLYVAILGIFQLGIPYVLLAHASGWCPPLVCALLSALEPLLNPLWVAIFDGEKPGLPAVAGALVVVVTVTLWCIGNEKKEAAAA